MVINGAKGSRRCCTGKLAAAAGLAVAVLPEDRPGDLADLGVLTLLGACPMAGEGEAAGACALEAAAMPPARARVPSSLTICGKQSMVKPSIA